MFSPRSALLAFITFIGGFYFFLEFVLPESVYGFKIGLYHSEILKGVQVVGAMAIGLGIINILRVHGRNVLLAGRNFRNSAALLAAFFTMLVVEIADFRNSEHAASMRRIFDVLAEFPPVIMKEAAERDPQPRAYALVAELEKIRTRVYAEGDLLSIPMSAPSQSEEERGFAVNLEQSYVMARDFRDSFSSGDPRTAAAGSEKLSRQLRSTAETVQLLAAVRSKQAVSKRISSFLYQGLFVPLGSAMFALLAFYIATAAYRSFRVRSVEAAIMMCTAVVVMLGQIPFGPLYISSDLPLVRNWLLENINTPAFRAIYFGSAVAGLSMAVRMWLSIERGPLNDSPKEEG